MFQIEVCQVWVSWHTDALPDPVHILPSRRIRPLHRAAAATLKELTAYIEMGFFVSVAGGICREKSGAALREAVSRRIGVFVGTRWCLVFDNWLRASDHPCSCSAGL